MLSSLAAGESKYVCVYTTNERTLLRRFQLSDNLALDGVLDMLNSKNMTDAGPLGLIEDEGSEDDDVAPGAGAAAVLPLNALPAGMNANSLPGTIVELLYVDFSLKANACWYFI